MSLEVKMDVKRGYLGKKGGGKFSAKRKRWFVLNDETIQYFESENELKPLGSVPLAEVTNATILGSGSFKVVTNYREYELFADTIQDAVDWADSIEKRIEKLRQTKQLTQSTAKTSGKSKNEKKYQARIEELEAEALEWQAALEEKEAQISELKAEINRMKGIPASQDSNKTSPKVAPVKVGPKDYMSSDTLNKMQQRAQTSTGHMDENVINKLQALENTAKKVTDEIREILQSLKM